MSALSSFEETLEIEMQRPFLSKGKYVYHLLKNKIVNGYLQPNKIYTIVEIAESLGLSRTPVGEAVKILGSQNYIILYPGVGFKVKEYTIADIHENLAISGALEQVVLRKIIQDENVTTEILQDAVTRSWNAIANQTPELYTQASADFHRTFYAMSGLPRVIEILREHVFVNEVWYREGACRYPEAITRLVADHEAIIALIERRDPAHIFDVINTHVNHCEELLITLIQP